MDPATVSRAGPGQHKSELLCLVDSLVNETQFEIPSSDPTFNVSPGQLHLPLPRSDPFPRFLRAPTHAHSALSLSLSLGVSILAVSTYFRGNGITPSSNSRSDIRFPKNPQKQNPAIGKSDGPDQARLA
ncbi:hypothetical protein MLD38_026017 [Melastoma candidum]|uniref:Uncharacterized protein n=1 Tax=Melastoma candidum TaxID=119954 RepID=A0ACB9NX96_9MYRT|nr:hypothetical protein MLD38_026017 [Melastoma candidum]